MSLGVYRYTGGLKAIVMSWIDNRTVHGVTVRKVALISIYLKASYVCRTHHNDHTTQYEIKR